MGGEISIASDIQRTFFVRGSGRIFEGKYLQTISPSFLKKGIYGVPQKGHS